MFRRIVVPLDGSSIAEAALQVAIAIAKASRAEIHLVLAHGAPTPAGAGSSSAVDAASAEQVYLARVMTDLRERASTAARCVLLSGPPAEMICEHARAVGADLIVMTSHGRTGFNRAWLGSVADAVVRRSSVPVLILRPHGDPTQNRRTAPARPFKHVLVPLDGSLLAADVLGTAADLAEVGGAHITLLRVVPPVPRIRENAAGVLTALGSECDEPATRQIADQALRQIADVVGRLCGQRGVGASADVVVSDRVAEAIVEYAAGHQIDVIAMSAHGRGLSRWLVGSVADKVLRGSEVPVLVRRSAAGWSDPASIDASTVAEQLPALSDA